MDYMYTVVQRINNPALRRVVYHLLQLVSGFVMGVFCCVVTRYFGHRIPVLDPEALLIAGSSLGVGLAVLSLSWYGKSDRAPKE